MMIFYSITLALMALAEAVQADTPSAPLPTSRRWIPTETVSRTLFSSIPSYRTPTPTASQPPFSFISRRTSTRRVTRTRFSSWSGSTSVNAPIRRPRPTRYPVATHTEEIVRTSYSTYSYESWPPPSPISPPSIPAIKFPPVHDIPVITPPPTPEEIFSNPALLNPGTIQVTPIEDPFESPSPIIWITPPPMPEWVTTTAEYLETSTRRWIEYRTTVWTPLVQRSPQAVIATTIVTVTTSPGDQSGGHDHHIRSAPNTPLPAVSLSSELDDRHQHGHGPENNPAMLDTRDSPPTISDTCLFVRVDLDLDKERKPGKDAYIQAACRPSHSPSNWQYRCSKLPISNCFSNSNGTLIPVTDNKGKWVETCTDCGYDAGNHNIVCTCWQGDHRPNVTTAAIDCGVWNINGLLHCGRDVKGEELELNRCTSS